MKRAAFSLIELLIVIMIIGVVYTLIITNFKQIANKEANLDLKNLKEYLSSLEFKKRAKIICLDDCSRCNILLDENLSNTIDGFLDETVRQYRFDNLYGYVELEREVSFNVENLEEDVCFSYELDTKGVGSQVLVEYKGKFYDFTSYFTKLKVYDSIEDAREFKEGLMREVRQ